VATPLSFTGSHLVQHRRRLAVAVTALVLLAPGCSDGASKDGAVGRVRERIGGAIRDALEEARERNEQQAGEVDRRSRDEPTEPEIGSNENVEFDYDEYQTLITSVLSSLEEYWAEALPAELGTRFTRPAGGYKYYRGEEGGPRCGNEQAPPNNAFYCPAGDFIAWDESGLMIPYYVSAGDFAAAYVLAHEYGHAIQARLGGEVPPRGVLLELQADCFAGSWARHISDEGRLEAGDLDESVVALYRARDVPGTPWTDPRAHGSAFDRTRAFIRGYDGGPADCARISREDFGPV
jgi:hypothetical protein